MCSVQFRQVRLCIFCIMYCVLRFPPKCVYFVSYVVYWGSLPSVTVCVYFVSCIEVLRQVWLCVYLSVWVFGAGGPWVLAHHLHNIIIIIIIIIAIIIASIIIILIVVINFDMAILFNVILVIIITCSWNKTQTDRPSASSSWNGLRILLLLYCPPSTVRPAPQPDFPTPSSFQFSGFLWSPLPIARKAPTHEQLDHANLAYFEWHISFANGST